MSGPDAGQFDTLLPELRFLAGGGAATRLILERDWTGHPLGPPAAWPDGLKTALSLILNSPESMILAWGEEELTFFFNETYFPLLGPRLPWAMGAPFRQVWSDAWLQAKPIIDDAFAGKKQRFDDLPWKLDTDRGAADTWWTFSYSRVLDGDGAIAGLFIFTNETTSRVLTDAALRELNATLEEKVAAEVDARMRTEEALRQSQKVEAIGQLTGGVAHDFNNLLTVIRGSVDLLRRPGTSEDRRARYIDAIADTADRAAKLTGQLLAFARRQTLKPEVFDAASNLSALRDMIVTLVGARIRVELKLPESPGFIDADTSQFDTALVNMAVNARDAMKGEGELTFAVGTAVQIPAVRAHGAVDGDFVTIAVSDTGSGIEGENIDRIFEPFFTTKGVGEGTGLGLSQVFGFAKQSGGEVHVASEFGRGTTFTLYLPRSVRRHEAASTAADTGGLPDHHGTCVLVVEDNRDVGRFATSTLDELGYATVYAEDAAAALAELEKDAARFNVVFSDVVMPGMNGLELARLIRARYPGLPVVLTSGYSHVLAEEGTGGFDLLQKPYSVDQLSKALMRAVDASSSDRAGQH